MNPEIWQILSIVLITACTFGLVIFQNWRLILLTLAAQYAGFFGLLLMNWTAALSASQIISGWIACAVLATAMNARYRNARISMPREEKNISKFIRIRSTQPLTHFPSSIVFRILITGISLVAIYSLANNIGQSNQGFSTLGLLSGLILIGSGFLQISLTDDLLLTSTGILTSISGFILFYSLFDQSVILSGLMAASVLGISLCTVYLINQFIEENPV